VQRIRAEAGHVLGGISDEEYQRLALVFRNNIDIGLAHRPDRFDGDVLLVAAEDDRAAGKAPDERWRPYVSGEITLVRLPCRHSDVIRPPMLEQLSSADAWAAAFEAATVEEPS
jgi:thioesterase domain-containing protein